MENDTFSGQWTGVFSAAAEGSCLQMTETIQGKHWWMRPLVSAPPAEAVCPRPDPAVGAGVPPLNAVLPMKRSPWFA